MTDTTEGSGQVAMLKETGAPSPSVRTADAEPADPTRRPAWKRFLWWGGWLGAVEIVVIAGLWQLVVSAGLVDKQQISTPKDVAIRFGQAFFTQRSIYHDLWVSGREILAGLIIGIAVGVIVGILMGRIPLVNRILDPIVAFLYATPVVAFIPLLIIWLGIGAAPKIVLIFAGVVFVVIVNTEVGVRTVEPSLIEMARSFNGTRFQVMRVVIIPSAVPIVLAGFRLAIGRALIMMMVGEMYGANGGLGYFISNAGTTYNTTDVLLGVIILAASAVILTRLLRVAESRVSHWRG